jgi:hypothetical protein
MNVTDETLISPERFDPVPTPAEHLRDWSAWPVWLRRLVVAAIVGAIICEASVAVAAWYFVAFLASLPEVAS